MPRKQPEQPRQRRYDPLTILSYISSYQQRAGRRSPSERRIQTDLGMSSPSVVHNLLRRLEQRGLLTITTYGRGHTSDLLITDAGQTALRRWRAEQGAADSSMGTGADDEPRD